MKNLKLTNWQRHKKLDLDISAPFVLITGPSSKGKSAIVKALKFVILNESKPSYVRNKSKKATVELDGVRRTRTKTGTGTYEFNGQVFKKFGKDVPEEVRQLFPYTQLNFIDQHNQHYLIHLSPAERAKLFYDLVGLSNVNEILEAANDELNEIKLDIRYKKKYLEDAKRKHQLYSKLASKIDELEKVEAQLEALKKVAAIRIPKVPELNVDLEPLKQIKAQCQILEQLSQIRIPKVPELNVDLEKLRQARTRLALLEKLANLRVPKPIDFDKLETLYQEYKLVKAQAELLTKLKTYSETKKVPEFKADLEAIKKLEQQQAMLKKLATVKKKFVRASENLDEAEQELHLVFDEMEVCPLCGTTLKGE